MDYSSITELNLSNKGLTKLPDLSLYTNLKNLNCTYNKITRLDNLTQTIIYLNCHNNQIATLDNLPQTITVLYCLNNPLKYNFTPTLENIRKHNITQNNIIKN